MELEIYHKTNYTYEQPVHLEPHYLNFKPLTRKYIELLDFDLQIDPTPANIFELIDAEGNTYHQVWADDKATRKLDIEAKIVVRTTSFNPFDFLLDPEIKPSDGKYYYSPRRKEFLESFLSHREYPSIKQYVDKVRVQSEETMVSFLALLIQSVYNGWEHVKRENEHPLDARQCFKEKKGSCKDLSWMVIVMLRGIGLATRFVSGYAYNPQLDFGHELHAWVEVLLPGSGWIGLDPSAGLFTNDHYVPVATSFDPSLTMPVDGTFLGNASSSLEASVDITVIKK
ncbi:transglutaminase family protein [Aliifodinibius sp. S!AR15-10]|uniref:transglutaminase family protein n=1 Tax=Aliifodinibius sp. S!AR15-10 TaxID=2950437 RepID=UPI0028558ABD|nr:transglutaminase family protein [Aliifodinibius sp. S!AR15-10]MDR8391630.1 transglutaminase family protein [Aliifodinibius sp. S!AR15-10]